MSEEAKRVVKDTEAPDECLRMLLIRKMEADPVIASAKEYIRELFRHNADGHDAEHTMRVYRNTLLIAEDEPDCDLKTAALAALLHDVDDHKLFKTENNENARTFLKKEQISEDEIDSICAIINAVSFSKNRDRRPETIEAKVVQDADRLDAMGAIGIARTFAYGGEHGRTMEESISHFHEKLLLLKDLMNTAVGREMAEERHLYMIRFLEEYDAEAFRKLNTERLE